MPDPFTKIIELQDYAFNLSVIYFNLVIHFYYLVQTGTNKKVAGAALRRTREGILLQGSVATNAIISRRSDRAELAAAFVRALATQCDAEIEDTNLDPTRLIASADRIF